MFIAFLAQSVYRSRWTCLAYCLMTNHFHLVLSLSAASLSRGMHRLNGTYARRFNERHGHHGHLFEARFSSTVIKSEEHYLDAIRYVALNPVAAGLCADPANECRIELSAPRSACDDSSHADRGALSSMRHSFASESS